MIDGIKATLKGDELKRLVLDRAKELLDIAANEAVRCAKLREVDKENASRAQDAQERHLNMAKSREFLAAHIETGETYRLDMRELIELGISFDEYEF